MTDRRAGRIPHVPSRGGSKQPRARRQDGAWRKKRSDAGKPRASKPVSLFDWCSSRPATSKDKVDVEGQVC